MRHVTTGSAARPAASATPREAGAGARVRDPPRAAASTPAAAPATEPLVDPVESTAPAHPRPHGDRRAGRRRTSPRPAPTSTANGPDPNAEFGFEGP